jgi:cholinesterase
MKVSLPIILGTAVCTLADPQASPLLESRDTSNWKVGQRVYTTSGPVDGHLAPNSSGVSEYLGIPFAQPPIGPLRFEAPQPYISVPDSVINGSEFGFSCPQIVPNASSIYETYDNAPAGLLPPTYLTWNLGQITPPPPYTPIRLGEDCLTLNVWTKPQVGDKAKAILFWIYGGGWSSGVSDVKYNFGQHLAAEGDVVVVTIK